MKIFKRHKKIYFCYFICSISTGCILLFLGGASHAFPRLTFIEILRPEVIRQYIFTYPCIIVRYLRALSRKRQHIARFPVASR